MPLPLAAVIPVAGTVAKAAAKVPVVGGVVSGAVDAVAGVFAGSDEKKDRDRIAGINAAFDKAVQGDVNAALYVRQRTGKWKAVQVPGYGLTGSGGSDPAQHHARITWQKVLQLPNGVGQKAIELYTALASGGALPGSPQAVLTNVAAHRTLGMPTWLLAIVVVGAVVAVVLWARK